MILTDVPEGVAADGEGGVVLQCPPFLCLLTVHLTVLSLQNPQPLVVRLPARVGSVDYEMAAGGVRHFQ